ncbi:MAG: response regulator [Acidobacteriota bacterium]
MDHANPDSLPHESSADADTAATAVVTVDAARPARVYVIDDSLSVCFAIARALGEGGFEVVTERSGQTALANVGAIAPDLVICDHILPDVEGFHICAFIKNSPALVDTPVLMISGLVDEAFRSQATAMGADGVLKKPFTAAELKAVVNSLVAAAATAQLASTSAARREPVPRPSGPIAVLAPDLATAEPLSPAAAASLMAALAPLGGIHTLRFAGLLDPNGAVVQGIGSLRFLRGEPAVDLTHLRRVSEVAARRLDHGPFRSLVLESDPGVVLIQQLVRGHLLVIAVDAHSALGKARYMARRQRAALEAALQDTPRPIPDTRELPELDALLPAGDADAAPRGDGSDGKDDGADAPFSHLLDGSPA